MTSSIAQYLRSGTIIISHNPTYDDKGRQLPFDESPHQRHERHAFVKSLQLEVSPHYWKNPCQAREWQRNVANWMHDQRREHNTAESGIQSSSSSSSESSSPRTPASPLNIPHTHADPDTLHQQKIKLQTVAALDAELAKLVLASRQLGPPQHRQCRNYKNLHLPNTTAFRYQPRSRVSSSQPQRLQASASIPTRDTFDSTGYPTSAFPTYPSLHHTDVEQELDSGEPYIFYSSSFSAHTSRPSTSSLSITTATSPTSNTTTSKPQPAGIGEFPYPPHSRSLSLMSLAPLTSPSSSSSPRTLTCPSSSATGSASTKLRAGQH